jgi:hypothetical protein
MRYHKGMLLTAARPLKARKPSHFARLNLPEAVPNPLRVTSRVLTLLSELATYRFLSTDQLVRIDGGSPAHLRHLLRMMLRHGLVLRPPGQAAYLTSWLHEGNTSLTYAITRRGMSVLAEHGRPVDPRLDWTHKNSGDSHRFLAHQLGVANLMLDIRLALPADKSLVLIDAHELLPLFPVPTQSAPYPFRVSVAARIDRNPQTITVIPDRLFRLQTLQHHFNFAYEHDRGTETLRPKSKKSSSKATWFRKCLAYYTAYRHDRFREVWGFPSLRVLTSTPSEQRLANMLAVQSAATVDKAHGMFLYTTPERLKAHGVFGPAWRSASSDNIRLLER